MPCKERGVQTGDSLNNVPFEVLNNALNERFGKILGHEEYTTYTLVIKAMFWEQLIEACQLHKPGLLCTNRLLGGLAKTYVSFHLQLNLSATLSSFYMHNTFQCSIWQQWCHIGTSKVLLSVCGPTLYIFIYKTRNSLTLR